MWIIGEILSSFQIKKKDYKLVYLGASHGTKEIVMAPAPKKVDTAIIGLIEFKGFYAPALRRKRYYVFWLYKDRQILHFE